MASDEQEKQEKQQLEAEIEEVIEEAEYTSHKQQVLGSRPTQERIDTLRGALLTAFEKVIDYEKVAFIRFGDLDVFELAAAFIAQPIVIKATCACVNVAIRAIERDLHIRFNTYTDKISPEAAHAVAGYLKPFLPDRIAVPALMELDRYFWTDKEMRAAKGRWEKVVSQAISAASKVTFRKRKFKITNGKAIEVEVEETDENLKEDEAGGSAREAKRDEFEIDAAYPPDGPAIEVAVDVKRIESRKDIHKRADEIINKATKFKSVFPQGKFFAVVYFPFPNEQINIQSRLQSEHLDGIYFAAETPSSIRAATDLLVGQAGLKKNG